MKAIVLSSDDDGSVILGADGIVYEVTAQYAVGDTVEYNRKKRYHVLRRAVAVAASLVLIITGIFTYSYQNLMVYATVRVDQIPGVEYLLNRKNRVVNIVSTSSGGQKTVKLLKDGGAVRVGISKALERSSKLTHTAELSVRVDCDDSKGMKIVENETSLVAAVVSVNDQETGNAVTKPDLEDDDSETAGNSSTAEETSSAETGSEKAAGQNGKAASNGTADVRPAQPETSSVPAAQNGSTSSAGAGAGTSGSTAERKQPAAAPEKVELSDAIHPEESVTLRDEKSDADEPDAEDEENVSSGPSGTENVSGSDVSGNEE